MYMPHQNNSRFKKKQQQLDFGQSGMKGLLAGIQHFVVVSFSMSVIMVFCVLLCPAVVQHM